MLSVNQQKIPVPLARLLAILGTDASVSDMKAVNAPAIVERRWPCGCVAVHDAAADDVAYWASCAMHADAFFDRHATRPTSENAARKRQSRRRWKSPVPLAPVVAATLAIACVEVTAVLYKRALRAGAVSSDADTIVDALTGLYNRRGWDRRCLEEQKRVERYAEEAMTVFLLDVDHSRTSGDRVALAARETALRGVADALRSVTREHDVAARISADRFALLAMMPIRRTDAEAIKARLRAGFTASNLSLTIGDAAVDPSGGVAAAMEQAEISMHGSGVNPARA